MERQLLELGVNPAGPEASKEQDGDVDWWRFFPPPSAEWEQLPDEREALKLARQQLDGLMAEALFDGMGRDFESLGIGVLRPSNEITAPLVARGIEQSTATELLRVAVRLYGLGGNHANSGREYPSGRARLRQFVDGLDLGLEPAVLHEVIVDCLQEGRAIIHEQLDLAELVLEPPPVGERKLGMRPMRVPPPTPQRRTLHEPLLQLDGTATSRPRPSPTVTTTSRWQPRSHTGSESPS